MKKIVVHGKGFDEGYCTYEVTESNLWLADKKPQGFSVIAGF